MATLFVRISVGPITTFACVCVQALPVLAAEDRED